MKKNVTKALTLGMAGLTAVNSIPINVFADGVRSEIISNMESGDIFKGISVTTEKGNTVTLDMSNASKYFWYMDDINKKLVLKSDTAFSMTAVSGMTTEVEVENKPVVTESNILETETSSLEEEKVTDSENSDDTVSDGNISEDENTNSDSNTGDNGGTDNGFTEEGGGSEGETNPPETETKPDAITSFKVVVSNGTSEKVLSSSDNSTLAFNAGDLSIDSATASSILVKFEFESGATDEVNLMDLLGTKVSGVSGVIVDTKAPTVALEGKTLGLSDGTKVPGQVEGSDFLKGGVVCYSLNIDPTVGEVVDTGKLVYEAKVNDIALPSNWIEFDEATNKLLVKVYLDSELLKLNESEGTYTLSVSVADYFGNASEYSDTLKIDNAVPVLNVSDYGKSGILDSDSGVTYFKDADGAFFNLTANDNGSGIKNIELLKDGAVVSSSEGNSSFNAKISEKGSYSFKVTDKLGNEKIYKISELCEGYSDTLDFDAVKPTIAVEIDGKDAKDVEWLNNSKSMVLKLSDNTRIKSIEYTVNGKTTSEDINSASKDVTIDLSKYQLSEKENFEVSVSVTDVAGNVAEYSNTFKSDIHAPEMGSVKLDSDVIVLGDFAFISKPVNITGNFKDSESGIGSVKVYKGDEVVATELPYKISKSGRYKVEVTDKVGNISVFNLSDIVGDEFGDIIYDDVKPVIKEESGFDCDLGQGGVKWYKKNPTLQYDISDDNLNTVELKLDGKVVTDEVNPNRKYTVAVEGEDGSHTIEVVAKDKAGNTSTSKYTFKVDSKKPEKESFSLDKEYQDKESGMFFKEEPTVSVKYVDGNGTGISKYTLYTYDGSKYTEVSSNTTGKFKLSGGEYFIEAEDGIGNTSGKISIKDLAGSKSNAIVVDSGKIKIDFNRPEGDLNGWFANDVTYSGKITSGKSGIAKAELYINDKLVDTKGSETSNVVSADLSGSTKGIEPKDGYKYEVRVSVTDNAGNSSSWSDTIYVDKDSPVITESNMTGNYIFRNGKLYFKSQAKFSVKANDTGVGVNKYYITDSKGVKTEIKNIKEFTIEDGKSSISVEDKLGNETKPVAVKDLYNLESDVFVVDNSSPTITVEKGNPIKDNWYNKDLDFKVKAKDNEGIYSSKVKVNGEIVAEYTFKEGSEAVSEKVLNGSTKDIEAGQGNKYVISIEVEGLAGNKEVHSETVRVDKDAPEITDSTMKGDYIFRDGKLYFKEKAVFSVKAEDSGIGVSKYYLIDSEGTESEISDISKFTINDGKSSIVVEDELGNKSNPVKVKDLYKLESDIFVVDSEIPEVSIEKDKAVIDNWYKDDVDFVAKAVDNEGIYSLVAKVNGKDVASYEFKDGSKILKEKELNASTKGIDSQKGNVYSLSVEVEDMSGNKDTYSEDIRIDKDAPEIKESAIDGEYLYRNGKLYFKEKAKFSLKAEDSGIGVDKYYLVDSKGTKTEIKDISSFTIEDGKSSIVVEDKLGNASKPVSVKDLYKLESDIFVVDESLPTITVEKEDALIDNWYNKDVDFTSIFKDNEGIYSAVVRVNNKVISEYHFDEGSGVLQEKSLNASTKDIEAKDGNTYTISIEVEDLAGNTEEYSEDVRVDKDAPEIVKSFLNGEFVQYSYGVYFKTKPGLKVDASDKGIGLENVILVDKDGKEVTSATGEFTLDTGEYSVKAKDKLGNTSDPVSLAELCDLMSNNIVVDGESPEIESQKPDGVYEDWFNNDVKYNVVARDTKGVQKAEVLVNGKVVDEFTASSGDVTEKTLKVSTEGIESNSDASYLIEVNVVDNAGNTAKHTEKLFIDNTKPTVDKFVITAEGYKEGSDTNGSNQYGFYLSGASSVDIHVSDGNKSSGIKNVAYKLLDGNGKIVQESVISVDNSGVASVNIPDGFKGFVEAYAVDNVNNTGDTNRPDGIITESGNVHVNHVRVNMSLPDTPYKDANGNNLYNSDIVVGSSLVDSHSGLRNIEWGINGSPVESNSVDNEGSVTGGNVHDVITDKNLVTGLSKNLQVGTNENGVNVWLNVTDRVGNVSKDSRVVSIDKDAPVIGISYDVTNPSNYYNGNRVATITINERNFRPSDVKFEGNVGKLTEWSQNGNGVYSCQMIFAEDGDYNWSVKYTDMAGNAGNTYNSEQFTIDKTAPVVNVSYDNNDVRNGNFYNSSRTATVSVTEHNFDPSTVKYSGTGSISSWSSNGDVHTANVVFSEDGAHEFSIELADKAGNKSNTYQSEKFIVDKKSPVLNVKGVQNGTSYKDGVPFTVSFSDEHIDVSKCFVTLKGRTNGDVRLVGSIDDKTGEFVFDGFPDDVKYDDLYKLNISVYDKAGNSSSEDITYSINRYGSKFNFLNERLRNNIVNKAEDVVMTETSVDRLDLSACKVVIIRDGEEISVKDKYITIKESGGVDSPWVYTYTVNKEAFDEDGKYQVQIYSKTLNGDGNTSLKQEYAFILDRTKPEIIISGVEDGEVYSDVKRKVTVEVRDLSGVGKIEAKVNGEKVKLEENSGIYSFEVHESNEKQSISVEVTDKAGNIDKKDVEDFVVSTNMLVSVANNPLIKWIAGILGVSVVALILLLLGRKRKKNNEEAKLAEENARLYQESVSNSGSNSSTSGTEKNDK